MLIDQPHASVEIKLFSFHQPVMLELVFQSKLKLTASVTECVYGLQWVGSTEHILSEKQIKVDE